MKLALLLPFLLLGPTIAAAQSASPSTSDAKRIEEQNAGVPDAGKPKDQIRVEENAIVPYAGRSGPSAAPTMALDCQAKPADCSQPVGPLRSPPIDAQSR